MDLNKLQLSHTGKTFAKKETNNYYKFNRIPNVKINIEVSLPSCSHSANKKKKKKNQREN